MTATEIASLLAGRAEDVARHLLPNGRRVGREWCCGSLTGESGKSLKIALTGTKAGQWADFAGSESGDLVGLWRAVRGGLDLRSACVEALAWLGIADDGHRRQVATKPRAPARQPRPAASAAIPAPPQPIPPDVAALWQEGVDHLLATRDLCARIDLWRSWPAGTSRTLATDGVLGCPLVDGKRSTAFSVLAPYRDEIGCISTRLVGFHARLKPREGAKPQWRYVPAGVGSLPFVIGAGCVEYVNHVVVLEGPWDAVAFAAHARWLSHETAWPERVVVFGVRGANVWRPLVDVWLPFVPPDAQCLLVQDADPAGDAWRTTFAPALTAASFGVRVLRPRGAKDFSDLARVVHLDPEEILT